MTHPLTPREQYEQAKRDFNNMRDDGTLTPREKVELKPCPFCGGDAVAGSNFDNDHYVMCGADCDKCGGMVGYMKTEMAAIENWNRRTALASGSGDHAELARLADDLRKFEHHAVGSLKIDMGEARRIIAVCDAHIDLLAENAALRAENDVLEVERIGLRSAIFGSHDYDPGLRHVSFIEMARTTEDARRGAVARATEAERKLAEAVGLLTGLCVGTSTVKVRAVREWLSKKAERVPPAPGAEDE